MICTVEWKNDDCHDHHDHKHGESAVTRPLFAARSQHVFDQVEIKYTLCARHLIRLDWLTDEEICVDKCQCTQNTTSAKDALKIKFKIKKNWTLSLFFVSYHIASPFQKKRARSHSWWQSNQECSLCNSHAPRSLCRSTDVGEVAKCARHECHKSACKNLSWKLYETRKGSNYQTRLLGCWPTADNRC